MHGDAVGTRCRVGYTNERNTGHLQSRKYVLRGTGRSWSRDLRKCVWLYCRNIDSSFRISVRVSVCWHVESWHWGESSNNFCSLKRTVYWNRNGIGNCIWGRLGEIPKGPSVDTLLINLAQFDMTRNYVGQLNSNFSSSSSSCVLRPTYFNCPQTLGKRWKSIHEMRQMDCAAVWKQKKRILSHR